MPLTQNDPLSNALFHQRLQDQPVHPGSHCTEEKEKPLAEAPSGITGLETSLGLGLLSLVEPGHLTLLQLMACMSKNPAEFYRMIPGSVPYFSTASSVSVK